MDNNAFTGKEITFYRELLDKFPGEKHIKSETTADVLCTVHADHNPSLGVDLSRNGVGAKVLVNCRSQGCDCDEVLSAVGLTYRDLYFEKPKLNGKAKKLAIPGCTLEEYSEAKNLPIDFLTGEEVRLERSGYGGKPAIRIPYLDEDGDEVAVRFRVGLKKSKSGPDNRFRWKAGDKPNLYGRHLLREAREAGYVLLVEGESDCHVLWRYGKPAVGVPGVENWKDQWASYLDGIDKILVCIEPDAAGQKLWGAISNCSTLTGRLARVVFQNAL